MLATSTQKNQIIQAAKKSSKNFNAISKQLELANIRLFTNSVEGTTVVIFSYLNNQDKSFALKGSFLKGLFFINNEIYIEKITEGNETQTIISKDNESILVKTENNIERIHNVDLGTVKLNILDVKSQLRERVMSVSNPNKVSLAASDDRYGNHGGNGFCQRERNESFSTCFKAECDEFCDDFFSCVALQTNPPVAILIAAACSCSASQSD